MSKRSHNRTNKIPLYAVRTVNEQVNTTFVVNNKNVLSVNTTAVNNISRTYAIMTKEEVLRAMDSVGYWKAANNEQ